MSQYCHSCAASLDNPDFKGESDIYCKFCVDAAGNLKSREAVQKGTTSWFTTWQPNLNETTANERAATYMSSLPAWAE
ncbi:MAG: hypothetical protein H0W86_10885 [Armatimonadetes bacterium]|nr:hypothetical protein [Armatimonadota bacterium]